MRITVVSFSELSSRGSVTDCMHNNADAKSILFDSFRRPQKRRMRPSELLRAQRTEP